MPMSTAHTAPTRQPDPRRLAALLVRAWFEVVAGDRPAPQLAPLLAPALRRRLPTGARRDAPTIRPRVRRVTGQAPSAGRFEAAVVIEHAERTTAVAVRLEQHRGRWRAVELTAPEDGYAPLRTASLPPGHRPTDAFDEVLALDDDAVVQPA